MLLTAGVVVVRHAWFCAQALSTLGQTSRAGDRHGGRMRWREPSWKAISVSILTSDFAGIDRLDDVDVFLRDHAARTLRVRVSSPSSASSSL
jgi:hypothetical protein